jgi:putative DNA primase/helicase
MPEIDFDALAQRHPIATVVARKVQLKRAGKGEHKGLCPFHNEKTPSFTVSSAKGFFHCYGCGEHGDVVDFVARTEGVSIAEAVRLLDGDWTPAASPAQSAPSAREEFDPYAGIVAAEIPDSHEMFRAGDEIEAWNPRKERVWRIRPSMVFPYRAGGELVGYVVRVEFDGGKKVTPTLRWVRLPDGRETWAVVPFDKPRPLYWARSTGGQVLVVEGEKAADAAARLLPIAVVTWPGGTQGVKHADWSPLAGRSVVVWPDADEAGLEAAQDIARRLVEIGCSVKVARPPEGAEKGWDAADAEADGWDRGRTIDWLRSACAPPEPPPEPEEPPPAPEEGARDWTPTEPAAAPPDRDRPFRVLGYDGSRYFYLPVGTQQVVELQPASHTWRNLIQLAPLDWLHNEFSDGKQGELAAANSLMNEAHRAGTFWPERLRGRGAWVDGDDVLYHVGQAVKRGADTVGLWSVSSGYIYPAARPMRDLALDVDPATGPEAKALADICARLSWENPLSAVALAGWIAIAPFCGALRWRPHVWITGGAGSGKTTVLLDIVWRLVGVVGQRFEGSTTEAGIRQTMGADALPVILDEAEAETERAQQRMQGIMDLARLASSGSTVAKGSGTGDAVRYTVRSMFCFSSIEHSIKQHADETRITKLVLRKRTDPTADADYKALMRDIRAQLGGDFASRLWARTWGHIDTVLANVATCTDAAAQETGDRRAADQIGTLIAGYVSLHTTKRITFDQAVDFVRRYDWTDHAGLAARADRDRLLERILSHRLTVTSGSANKQTTIGELIQSARGGTWDRVGIAQQDASIVLGSYGLRVLADDRKVAVASSCGRMSREVLRGTQWESDWSRPLRELPGATVHPKVVHFTGGLKARATLLPIEAVAPPDPLLDGPIVADHGETLL